MEDTRQRCDAVSRVIPPDNCADYIEPGLRLRLHQAINTLKSFKISANKISTTERISLALHRLDLAFLQRDAMLRGASWHTLLALEQQWLSAPVPSGCEAGS